MQLLFASQNKHKIEEIKPLLPASIELLSLAEVNYFDDIPETSPTLEGNAFQKAEFIYAKFKIPCFADDTGLEIEALDGRPGVYSARYAHLSTSPKDLFWRESFGQAGEKKNPPQDVLVRASADDNIQKVLGELAGVQNRTAVFKTVIALAGLEAPLMFEGIIKGSITTDKRGTNGFGYDPIFMPEGYNITFAQMSLDEKNKLSHRANAVKKFAEWLKNRVG